MDNLRLLLFVKKYIFDINKNNEVEFGFSLFNKQFIIRKKSKDYEHLQEQINNLNNQVTCLANENRLLYTLLKRSIDIKKIPCASGNLRKVQLIKTKLLELTSYILEKNNIKFWLDYGTLIGTIRHNGFIPWDDDIDLSMLKEDYLKLPEIFSKLTKYDPNFKFSYNYGQNIIFRIFYKEFFVDFFPFEYIDKANSNFKDEKIFLKKWHLINDLMLKEYAITNFENDSINGLLIQDKANKIKKDILGDDYIINNPSDKIAFSPEFWFVCDTCTILNIDKIFPLEKHCFETLELPIPNKPIEHLFELGVYGELGDVMNFPKITDSGFHHTQANYENNGIDYDIIYRDLISIVETYKKNN